MNILLVLVPISLVLLLIAIGAFAWAVRRGQFEDLDAAALDILREDAGPDAARGKPAASDEDRGDPHAD